MTTAIDLGPLAQWFVNQGFAVAVAAYVLVRLDARLQSIERLLTQLIVEHKAVIGHAHAHLHGQD